MQENRYAQDRAVAQKGERIVTALYMVTDLMSEHEPLKRSIRQVAVHLIDEVSTLAQAGHADAGSGVKRCLIQVTQLLSYSYIARTSGLMSSMNADMVIEALRSLQTDLEKRHPFIGRTTLLEHITDKDDVRDNVKETLLSSSFDPVTPLTQTVLRSDDFTKSHVSKSRDLSTLETSRSTVIERPDNRVSPDGRNDMRGRSSSKSAPRGSRQTVAAQSRSAGRERGEGGTQLGQGEAVSRLGVATPYPGAVSSEGSTQGMQGAASAGHASGVSSRSGQVRKDDRREKILALFVAGVDLGIKDVSGHIRGCSEKTIQRELNALLDDGTLKRIGEKRWSRYMLA